MPGPASVVLIGMMGCGKSEVGRRLATALGMEFVDLDAVVEQEAGRSVTEIFSVEGEAGFRVRERAAVGKVAGRPGLVVAGGGGVVLDPANAAALRSGATVVWLQVSPGVAAARLGTDAGRPVLAGRRGDLESRLRALTEERSAAYQAAAHLAVDGDGSPGEVAGVIAAALGARPAEVR
ncbi:MAG TPA: shikimate kinase [Actinomycetota bacterium]|nr:shikimate kinase [Actinomycetota bacterium]